MALSQNIKSILNENFTYVKIFKTQQHYEINANLITLCLNNQHKSEQNYQQNKIA